MFDGNMFFDEQGMPILKIALKRMLFDEALPDPFSVATQMLRSLINGVSNTASFKFLVTFRILTHKSRKTTHFARLTGRVLIFRVEVFGDLFPSSANLLVDVERPGILEDFRHGHNSAEFTAVATDGHISDIAARHFDQHVADESRLRHGNDRSSHDLFDRRLLHVDFLGGYPFEHIALGEDTARNLVVGNDDAPDVLCYHHFHDLENRRRNRRFREIGRHDLANFVGKHSAPPAMDCGLEGLEKIYYNT